MKQPTSKRCRPRAHGSNSEYIYVDALNAEGRGSFNATNALAQLIQTCNNRRVFRGVMIIIVYIVILVIFTQEHKKDRIPVVIR